MPLRRELCSSLYALSLCVLSLCASSSAFAGDDPQQDFEKRVQEYQKLRQPLTKQVPPLKPTKVVDDIRSHQKDMAASIRIARKDARQGDLFTPEIATEFRRLITQTMTSREGPKILKSMRRAEPVALSLHVNDDYPAKVPLQSTPPTLLMNLPRLPKELDYRLIGRALAVRDCDANIIVDFLPDAITLK